MPDAAGKCGRPLSRDTQLGLVRGDSHDRGGLALVLGLVQLDAHAAPVSLSDEEAFHRRVDRLEHLPAALGCLLVVGQVVAQRVGERPVAVLVEVRLARGSFSAW